MSESFRLILAQENATVGGLEGNARKIIDVHRDPVSRAADMVAFPEMFLSGYPAQDLVLKRAFVDGCRAALDRLKDSCAEGPAIGVGAPCVEDGKLHNAYFVLRGGKVVARILKHHLPNSEVFDEKRLFSPGPISGPYRIGPVRIGTPICEDAWQPDVTETLVESGAQIILIPNGSPYHRGKMDIRFSHMVARVIETGLPLAYLNLVGGQDDLMFDGGSFVLNPGGGLAAQTSLFDNGLQVVEFREGTSGWTAVPGDCAKHGNEWESDYRAMVEAIRDYAAKSGFSAALVGLSGGVDSALVATIAADAIGPGNVRCVMLPSDYTSPESLEDADAVANLLGCRIDRVGIAGPQLAVEAALAPLFRGSNRGTAEENIQSRLRGLLLMAISNKFGELLLTTGNKSEAAVGYATIYGDMAGGYNPIKDLYKTRVFATCRWRNENHRSWMKGPTGRCVPDRVLTKPPSAELRPDQRDTDSLPPYDILDRILEQLIDNDLSVHEVLADGFDRETVQRVEQLIYASEHKRFQSAPGVRLTGRALWLDRRYPIVNHWRDATGDSQK